MIKKITALLLIFAGSGYLAKTAAMWEKTGESNGIITYQKPGNSRLLQVKGITIIDLGIDRMGNLFRDIPNHVKWVGYCNEAKILEVINRNQYVFYETMTPPWPVNKRDMVLESKSRYLNDELAVEITSRAIDYKKFPPPAETIRIKKLHLTLHLEYVTRNKTGLTYEINVDPAGDIPGFISNIFNQLYVMQNLGNLKVIAADKKYIDTLNDAEDTELVNSLVADEDITKNSLKVRLSRLIKSRENLDHLVNDPVFLESWKENRHKFAENLFYAGHDENIAKDTVTKIIHLYLARFQLNEQQKVRLANSQKVQKIFIQKNIVKDLNDKAVRDLLI